MYLKQHVVPRLADRKFARLLMAAVDEPLNDPDVAASITRSVADKRDQIDWAGKGE